MLNAGSGYSTLGVGKSVEAGREGSETSITGGGGGGVDGEPIVEEEGDAADERELDSSGTEVGDGSDWPRTAAAYETDPLLVRRGGTGRLGVGAVNGGANVPSGGGGKAATTAAGKLTTTCGGDRRGCEGVREAACGRVWASRLGSGLPRLPAEDSRRPRAGSCCREGGEMPRWTDRLGESSGTIDGSQSRPDQEASFLVNLVKWHQLYNKGKGLTAVVEPCVGSAVDGFDAVVDDEALLEPEEDVRLVLGGAQVELGLDQAALESVPRKSREAAPVLEVVKLGGAEPTGAEPG